MCDRVMTPTKAVLKWSGDDIMKFLDIFIKYDGLWNTSNENYMKRNSREHSLENLRQELIEAGLDIPDEDVLKRKMKNLKDSYRIELNKVKKSKKSGADRTRLTIGLLQLARVNSLRVTG